MGVECEVEVEGEGEDEGEDVAERASVILTAGKR